MKTIAVFFGGRSSEHEISVITGMYAVNLLRGAGYRVLPVYLPMSGGMIYSEKLSGVDDFKGGTPKCLEPVILSRGGLVLEKKPKKRLAGVDCALNCCHGGAGEGGVLSALLEWHGIPSASPGVPESAVFLDKALTKIALKGLGVPVASSVTVREESPRAEAITNIENVLGYPAIVKPSRLGSSVGISVAHNREELEKALDFAFRLDSVVLVEEYLAGKRDLNCAAYRKGAEIVLSQIEEVFSSEPILTFGEKYESAGSRTSKMPADLPEEIAAEIHEILRRTYEAFGMRGVVRADFLLADGKVYFNELNTVPGTLATYLFGESLTSARGLLITLVEEAISKKRAEKETVSSGILRSTVFGGKSAKRR